MQHETPMPIARKLARYLPNGGKTFLEPAVGAGALVEAAVRRIRNQASRIVCIDSNPDLVQSVKDRIPEKWHEALEMLQGDFLSPVIQAKLRSKFGLFDCVFM